MKRKSEIEKKRNSWFEVGRWKSEKERKMWKFGKIKKHTVWF